MGSGPDDCDGSSAQGGYVFVYDLKTLQRVQTMATGEAKASMATPVTLDIDLNYNTELMYIGENYLNVTAKGRMSSAPGVIPTRMSFPTKKILRLIPGS